MLSCAVSNVKRVSLELGGKSPLIIFSDCDIDKAVRQVSSYCVYYSGLHLLTYSHWVQCSLTKERIVLLLDDYL